MSAKENELRRLCNEFNKRISEFPEGNGSTLDGGSKDIQDLWKWLWAEKEKIEEKYKGQEDGER